MVLVLLIRVVLHSAQVHQGRDKHEAGHAWVMTLVSEGKRQQRRKLSYCKGGGVLNYTLKHTL